MNAVKAHLISRTFLLACLFETSIPKQRLLENPTILCLSIDIICIKPNPFHDLKYFVLFNILTEVLFPYLNNEILMFLQCFYDFLFATCLDLSLFFSQDKLSIYQVIDYKAFLTLDMDMDRFMFLAIEIE